MAKCKTPFPPKVMKALEKLGIAIAKKAIREAKN